MNRSNQFSKSNRIVWNGSRLQSIALVHKWLQLFSLWTCLTLPRSQNKPISRVIQVLQSNSTSMTELLWKELMSTSRAADRRSMNVYSGNQGNALSATCWQTVNLRLIQLICCLFHADIFLCIISQNWRKNILFLLQILKLYSQLCCMHAASLFGSWFKCSGCLSFSM